MEQVQPPVKQKEQWEPMRLTPVGNLGTVMQAMNGSPIEGHTANMKP